MTLLDKKEPVKRVEKSLKQFDKSLKVLTLNSSARTAFDASKSLKCEVGAIVKSLLFKTDDSFVLCLVSGDRRCSVNKLKQLSNKKDISMANPKEVKDQTGFTIGGVSPVGHINELKIIIDKTLNRFEEIYAAAGHPNCVFKINFENLQKITNADIAEISE
tara:strand:+ start:41 stop:523 length:483 start_codon:yes stop_codon:yes gene_type:complete